MIDRIEVENVQLSTYNMTGATAEQKELLRWVGTDNLLSLDVVEKAKSSLKN